MSKSTFMAMMTNQLSLFSRRKVAMARTHICIYSKLSAHTSLCIQ
jgi:hypothetical protein